MANLSGVAQCKFCELVQGKLEAGIVFEDSVSIAFLDHRPLFPGHSLLIPKDHYETLLDLNTALITSLFSNAELLSRSMAEGLGAEGSFVAVNNRVSRSVAHFDIHVATRRRKDGLKGVFRPRQKCRGEPHMAPVGDEPRSASGRLAQVRDPGNQA